MPKRSGFLIMPFVRRDEFAFIQNRKGMIAGIVKSRET